MPTDETPRFAAVRGSVHTSAFLPKKGHELALMFRYKRYPNHAESVDVVIITEDEYAALLRDRERLTAVRPIVERAEDWEAHIEECVNAGKTCDPDVWVGRAVALQDAVRAYRAVFPTPSQAVADGEAG